MCKLKFKILIALLFFILFNSCESEKESENSLLTPYNGIYKGESYDDMQKKIGDWTIEIDQGNLKGSFDETSPITNMEGSISENGIIKAHFEIDNMSTTINGRISLENKTLTGTWMNEYGYNGSFSGKKL